jgi:hypothetical protein
MSESESKLGSMNNREKGVMIAGFLYGFTFQKYALRDSLSQSIGFQGVLEAVLTLLAFLIVVLQSRRMPRRWGVHTSIGCFAVYGILALASSINSFNAKLSLVKGILYLSVLALAYLIAEMQMSLAFLDGVYRSYVTTLLGALAIAAVFPAKYPLFSVAAWDGRTRLALLSTHPNSVGEVSGLLFLLAQVLPIRTRWYWQAFLFGINVMAGEKTATAAVILSSILIFLFGHRRIFGRLRFAAVASALACAALIAIVAGALTSSAGTIARRAAESIYGTKVSNEVASLDGRAAVWTSAAELAGSCVFLGKGFDGARDFLVRRVAWSGHAHNGFLQAVLSAGLLGSLALVTGWLAAAKDSVSGARPWKMKVLSLYLYLFWLAMIGPVFDSPSFFTILLFVSVSYFTLDHLASWKVRIANPSDGPSALLTFGD